MNKRMRFFYRRVLDAQLLVRQVQQEHKGLPMVEIYRQYIRDSFHISESTFNRWMGIPAAAYLKEIENNNNLDKEDDDSATNQTEV